MRKKHCVRLLARKHQAFVFYLLGDFYIIRNDIVGDFYIIRDHLSGDFFISFATIFLLFVFLLFRNILEPFMSIFLKPSFIILIII